MRIIWFLTLLLPLSLFSQNNSGEIIYEDKRNIHKTLPPEMEAMKDRIPEFRSSKKILLFDKDQALYMNKPRTKEEKAKVQEFRGEGRRGFRGGRNGRNANNKFYTNFSEKKSIDSRDFFGKKFLIEGEREARKWKITGDQKQVGVYLCQKATFQDTTQSLVAWFTPMIPVSSGPDDFFGLPGLILHLDIDDGERVITAIDVQLKDLVAEVISRPKEGKNVTSEEFEEIRTKKMAEMKEEYGERGQGRRWRGRSGR